MTNQLKLEDFPSRDYDKLRYSDMDSLGHINNAVFTTLLETGRTTLLTNPDFIHKLRGYVYVIARLELDYLAELRWPGQVHIGTGVLSIGKTSIVVQQALFKDDICAAVAKCVMVQVGAATHRPEPITDSIRAVLEELRIKPASA